MSVEGPNGAFSRGAVTDCDQTGGRGEPETVNLDPGVDPNHGWRHTFKMRALGAGIEERLRDAITGHRVASVGRRYETPTLKVLADAMSRFPRYHVETVTGYESYRGFPLSHNSQ